MYVHAALVKIDRERLPVAAHEPSRCRRLTFSDTLSEGASVGILMPAATWDSRTGHSRGQ